MVKKLHTVAAALIGLYAAHVMSVYAQYDGLVINELLANPRNAGSVFLDSNADGVLNVFDDEFIELVNTSSNVIDVAGLWLADVNTNIKRHVFSTRLIPPSGSIVVFGGGNILSFSNPPAQIASGGTLSLNNNALETIHLFTPDTQIVDAVTYNLTATHDAISYVRNPAGTGPFVNHLTVSGGSARSSPGRHINDQSFLTNRPPVLLDLSDETAFVGSELTIPVRAYDPADRDAISLSGLNMPSNAFLAVTGNIATFSFTPASNQAEEVYTISFVASDTHGAETGTIEITVIDPVVNETVWINEVHYDNVSIDANEGIEIAGSAGTDLSQYSLLLYDGTFLTLDGSNALSGTIDDEHCGFGAVWFPYAVNQIENEVEGIALVKGETVVQFISYEGSFTPVDGPAAGMPSVDIGVDEEPAPDADYSLQLAGTGATYNAFSWQEPFPHSRGSLNHGQIIACLDPPELSLEKTVYLGHDGGASAPGTEAVLGTNGARVTYVFTVQNSGIAAVTNILIDDISLGIAAIPLGTLNAGHTVTAYIESVISGDLRNTAVVSGYGIYGGYAENQDSAEVIEIIPQIDIQKSVYYGHDNGASCPGFKYIEVTNGAPVTYCLTVANNGNTNLTSVTIQVTALGLSPIDIGLLAPGQLYQTSIIAFAAGSLTNVALVSGLDPNLDPVNDQDFAEIRIIAPAISVMKSVSDTINYSPASLIEVTNGAFVTYWMAVENSGDTVLTNVVLNDPQISFTTNIGQMSAGEVLTVSVGRVVGGDLTNTVYVSGEDALGSLYTNQHSAEVYVVQPSIFLEKTVSDNGLFPGSEFVADTNGAPVTYWFFIMNDGDTSLTNVFLDDPAIGFSTNLGTLAGGESITARVDRTIAGDLTNVAVAVGYDMSGTDYQSVDSAEVAEIIPPEIRLQKSVYLGHDGGASCPGLDLIAETNGAAITYCFVVENMGDSVLTNVVLRDDGLAGFSDVILGTLNPSEAMSFYYESFITGGDTLNVATVLAYTVDGELIEGVDTAEIDVPDILDACGAFKVVDLGTLGGTSSVAYGINDLEQVVGQSQDASSNLHAFIWENDVMSYLISTQNLTSSRAWDINHIGNVSGEFSTTGGTLRAFALSSTGVAVLATYTSGTYSVGRGLSESGDVVGLADTFYPEKNQPAIWRNGEMIPLGTFTFCIDGISCPTNPDIPDDSGVALDVNNAGQVVGFAHSWCPNDCWDPFIWVDANTNGMRDKVEMINLGSKGGKAGYAYNINELSEVVGWVLTNFWSSPRAFIVRPQNGEWNSVRWDSRVNEYMETLGTLGGDESIAYAINDSSDIVGSSKNAVGEQRAFLYTAGQMIDLNQLICTNEGWVLREARDINNSGQIAGTGLHNGETRAFLLTANTNSVQMDRVVYDGNAGERVVYWRGQGARLEYTLEASTSMFHQTWSVVEPSNQWPSLQPFYVDNVNSGNQTRFFRVKGVSAP